MEEVRFCPHIQHPFDQDPFSGDQVFGIEPLAGYRLKDEGLIIYLNLEYACDSLAWIRGEAKAVPLIDSGGDFTAQAVMISPSILTNSGSLTLRRILP